MLKEYAVAQCRKSLGCDLVYDGSVLKVIFIEGLHKLILYSMPSYWRTMNNAKVYDLDHHITLLTNLQYRLSLTEKIFSNGKPSKCCGKANDRRETRKFTTGDNVNKGSTSSFPTQSPPTSPLAFMELQLLNFNDTDPFALSSEKLVANTLILSLLSQHDTCDVVVQLGAWAVAHALHTTTPRKPAGTLFSLTRPVMQTAAERL